MSLDYFSKHRIPLSAPQEPPDGVPGELLLPCKTDLLRTCSECLVAPPVTEKVYLLGLDCGCHSAPSLPFQLTTQLSSHDPPSVSYRASSPAMACLLLPPDLEHSVPIIVLLV